MRAGIAQGVIPAIGYSRFQWLGSTVAKLARAYETGFIEAGHKKVAVLGIGSGAQCLQG